MAICTGQYVCLLLSASVLLNRFNIDTCRASFGLEAGCAFLIVAALHCFQVENSMFSTGSMTVKNHMEATNVLVV